MHAGVRERQRGRNPEQSEVDEPRISNDEEDDGAGGVRGAAAVDQLRTISTGECGLRVGTGNEICESFGRQLGDRHFLSFSVDGSEEVREDVFAISRASCESSVDAVTSDLSAGWSVQHDGEYNDAVFA